MSTRNIIITVLFLLALYIQYPLWFGKGGVFAMRELQTEVLSIQMSNDRSAVENSQLGAEILSLESGKAAVEEHARLRLNMLQKDEILFRFVPNDGSAEKKK